jgi:hypothetical protein
MSEPIQPLSTSGDADVRAAGALADLVRTLHTDPLATVLVSQPAHGRPYYCVDGGTVEVCYYSAKNGAELLAAAAALVGGTVTVSKSHGASEKHTLTTTWRDVPLQVSVDIPREDELEVLRKEIAELQAAERFRQALLDEQRHQVAEDVALDPAACTVSL